jgi:hypothetical protein
MQMPVRPLMSLCIVVALCAQACQPSRPDGASAEAMEKIHTGMTYDQIVALLGPPCWETEPGSPKSDPPRAWRTVSRTRGLYVEFEGSKAVGIVHFDTETMTFMRGGRFGYYIAESPEYRREIFSLLKTDE